LENDRILTICWKKIAADGWTDEEMESLVEGQVGRWRVDRQTGG